MLKIFILVSCLNTGDLAHKDAFIKAFSSIFPQTIYEVIDSSKGLEAISNEYGEAIKPNEKFITLAIGPSGQEALTQLQEQLTDKNNYVVLSTHQYSEAINDLIDKNIIQHIALPEAALSCANKIKIEKINKSLLFAVPTNNLNLEELKVLYENSSLAESANLNENYIIVTLPGDAPTPGGQMQLFTEASARELFEDVHKLWLESGGIHKIIIQNNPRTGRFASDGKTITCAHEYTKGEDPSIAIDNISKQFVSWLGEANMPYNFYNFAFEVDLDKKKPISFYNPLLYLAQANRQNYFITPGESVSMLGQIPLYISPDRNIVFKSSSMNDSHKAIFDLAVKRNYLSYFEQDGKIISAESKRLRTDDDAIKMIQDIQRCLNQEVQRAR